MNKLIKLLRPINIFGLIIAILVIGISTYNIIILQKSSTVTVLSNWLSMFTQLLLVLLFVVNGIVGLRNENATKRRMAYIYFIAATIMLILDIATIFSLLRSHGL